MRRRPLIAAVLPAWLGLRGEEAVAASAAAMPALPASARAALAANAASRSASASASASTSTSTSTSASSAAGSSAMSPSPSPQSSSPPSPPSSSPPSSDSQPALGVSHRPLRFPADHGAHPDTHIEWWYVTGWLRSASGGEMSGTAAVAAAGKPPEFGFQVTFFRTRTGVGDGSASRFAARQVVLAHVALTDLGAGGGAGGGRGGSGRGLMHDQRVAREGFGLVQTPGPGGTQDVRLRDWVLSRSPTPAGAPSVQRIDVRSERFALALGLQGTQAILLQGDAGYSQKGPLPQQASHYYSEPQLAVRGRVERAGQPAREVVGRAWLDHEWSDGYLPPEAVGWDWVGFNLVDGGALMAFRMRRADGSALWAGGTFRSAAGERRTFAPGEVAFKPLRRWKSPRTQTEYPVEWQLDTPAGSFRVEALQDDQELDSRDSTDAIYWEGVSALRRADGQPAGWGYLELTGYADRLRL